MNSWPYEQARLVRPLEGANKVVFETGFGSSGAPHIGTLAEVVRTSMVRRAFCDLNPNVETDLIVFADDYDGLRKIPDYCIGLGMEADLNHPLTGVRDPWGCHASFGDHNNALLIDLVQRLEVAFGFETTFNSATYCYRNGLMNDVLRRVMMNYEAVLDIILPTLGEERRATYSPFLPLSPTTGEVLQVPITLVDREHGLISFLDPASGNTHMGSIFNGEVKLQWKVDWAARWVMNSVDYEMSGKDLIDSVRLSSEIVRVLGGQPPVGMTYELFLDAQGRKVSKSKGNGFPIEEWLRYGSLAGLATMMFQNPKAAHRLSRENVPRAEDDLLRGLTLHTETPTGDSTVAHVFGSGNVPSFSSDVSYSLLLNLAAAAGDDADAATLESFLTSYRAITPEDWAVIRPLLPGVLAYARDVEQRSYRDATSQEAAAMGDLVERLRAMADNLDPEAYQYEVYEVGKAHGFTPLKRWFASLYEVLFGQSQGPRMGTFIAAFGRERTCELITRRLSHEVG